MHHLWDSAFPLYPSDMNSNADRSREELSLCRLLAFTPSRSKQPPIHQAPISPLLDPCPPGCSLWWCATGCPLGNEPTKSCLVTWRWICKLIRWVMNRICFKFSIALVCVGVPFPFHMCAILFIFLYPSGSGMYPENSNLSNQQFWN